MSIDSWPAHLTVVMARFSQTGKSRELTVAGCGHSFPCIGLDKLSMITYEHCLFYLSLYVRPLHEAHMAGLGLAGRGRGCP